MYAATPRTQAVRGNTGAVGTILLSSTLSLANLLASLMSPLGVIGCTTLSNGREHPISGISLKIRMSKIAPSETASAIREIIPPLIGKFLMC
jgi:hypothetical protein